MTCLLLTLQAILAVLVGLIFIFSSYACLLILLGSKFKVQGIEKSCFNYPSVSILIAAKNEAKVLPYTLSKLLDLDYPRDKLEILAVVDDDETLEACMSFKDAVKLMKFSSPKGKPSALNYALPLLKGELVLLLDADSIVGKDTLKTMVKFILHEDAVAVTAVPYPLNLQEGVLPQLFALECSLWEKLTYAKSRLGLFTQAPGSSSLIRSSWIRALGGWDEDSIAEDNDLAVRLMCRGGKVSLAPVKVGVEAPSKLSTFIKQRFRWYRGTVEVFKRRFKDLRGLKPMNKLDVILSLLSPLSIALFLPVLILALIFGQPILAAFLASAIIQLALTASIFSYLPLHLKTKALILSLPYLLLNSLIAIVALTSIVLRLKPRWTKTDKSGSYLRGGHQLTRV